MRKSVLVIDDRLDTRYVLEKRLRALGHRVYLAADGRMGIQLARQHRPDVVLIDVWLPDMDGYEVARQLRTELGGVPRIAAMSSFTEMDPGRSMDAGFDQYLRKPIAQEFLASWLGSVDR
jgi:CheY-like chemotaxis protein